MSMSSTSSLSSNTSNTNNNSSSSINSADKYAALKDLDEQFKEIKILGKIEPNSTNGTQGD